MLVNGAVFVVIAWELVGAIGCSGPDVGWSCEFILAAALKFGAEGWGDALVELVVICTGETIALLFKLGEGTEFALLFIAGLLGFDKSLPVIATGFVVWCILLLDKLLFGASFSKNCCNSLGLLLLSSVSPFPVSNNSSGSSFINSVDKKPSIKYMDVETSFVHSVSMWSLHEEDKELWRQSVNETRLKTTIKQEKTTNLYQVLYYIPSLSVGVLVLPTFCFLFGGPSTCCSAIISTTPLARNTTDHYEV